MIGGKSIFSQSQPAAHSGSPDAARAARLERAQAGTDSSMSSRTLSHALRGGLSVNVRRQALATRGGHAHRPPPPPFARIKEAAAPLHEEAELVWNDGVAPETLIDFDAPHIPKYQALRHWLYGLGAFATLMGVVTLYNPDSWRQASKRGNHLPDLKWELGEADEPAGEMDE